MQKDWVICSPHSYYSDLHQDFIAHSCLHENRQRIYELIDSGVGTPDETVLVDNAHWLLCVDKHPGTDTRYLVVFRDPRLKTILDLRQGDVAMLADMHAQVLAALHKQQTALKSFSVYFHYNPACTSCTPTCATMRCGTAARCPPCTAMTCVTWCATSHRTRCGTTRRGSSRARPRCSAERRWSASTPNGSGFPDTAIAVYIRDAPSSQTSCPGIAAATGTRVDSSSKQTMACRVSEPLSMQWCNDSHDARNYLHNHKMKFCMHKNDLVLNCGQSLNDCAMVMFNGKTYPSVVSNLCEMNQEARNVLKWLYHSSPSGKHFLGNKRRIQSEFVAAINSDQGDALFIKAQTFDKNRFIGELSNMPYFTAQGHSLGLAYTSSLSGDTVASVLIGGMQTVMNGHFDCRAGQVIQWYSTLRRTCSTTRTAWSATTTSCRRACARRVPITKKT